MWQLNNILVAHIAPWYVNPWWMTLGFKASSLVSISECKWELMDQDWKIKGKKKSTWRSSDSHPLFTNIPSKKDLKCLTNNISWQKTLEQCLRNLWGKECEPRMSRKSVSGMKMPPDPLWTLLGKNNFKEYSNQDESKILKLNNSLPL